MTAEEEQMLQRQKGNNLKIKWCFFLVFLFYLFIKRHLPLEVPRNSDLPVDQRLHHPTDHLVQRTRHVFTKFALKAALHVLPARGSESLNEFNSVMQLFAST